jgi:type III pantothenate kinase
MKQAKKQGSEILAIDIGNTSTFFAVYKGNKFKKGFRIKTEENPARAIAAIKKNLPVCPIKVALVASVVPKAGHSLRRAIPKRLGIQTLLVGRDLAVPIRNLAKKPKQVGVDRLLNALAAFRKYRKECIVIDFGTAITLDVISRKGEYCGGAIAPGIEISLDALFMRTALLPHIRLEHPSGRVGRDTVQSIRIGCAYGIGGLCDRLVQVIVKARQSRPTVLATGGYAKFMSRYCHTVFKIEPLLTTDGLRLAYLDSKENS